MAKQIAKKTATFDVHYIKSNDFKTVLATGIIGGLTPNKLIDINFFIDRIPIPQTVTHEIENDSLGREIRKETKKGIIREVNFGVVVNIETAKRIVDWLNAKISEADNIQEKS